MADYMLLIYDDPTDFTDLSPEDMQQIIAKYSAWGQRLHEEGKLVDSQKLADGEGRVLRKGTDGVRVLDGPYSETKEVVGGYFTIRAGSWEEAVAIAESCPHVESNGAIEIRRIEATGE